MRIGNRKIAGFGRGVLENSGLGEVAFFLKRAKTQVEHARFALEHTDFLEYSQILGSFKGKVEAMNHLMVDIQDTMIKIESDMARSVEEKEFASEQVEEKTSEL